MSEAVCSRFHDFDGIKEPIEKEERLAWLRQGETLKLKGEHIRRHEILVRPQLTLYFVMSASAVERGFSSVLEASAAAPFVSAAISCLLVFGRRERRREGDRAE